MTRDKTGSSIASSFPSHHNKAAPFSSQPLQADLIISDSELNLRSTLSSNSPSDDGIRASTLKERNAMHANDHPLLPRLLGYAGLLPFILTAGMAAYDPHHGGLWQNLLNQYAAVILSFLGAIYWGLAMAAPLSRAQRNGMLVWSVTPALLAWVALSLPSLMGALVMVTGFAAQLIFEYWHKAWLHQWRWYWPLRMQLTLIACIAIAVGNGLRL